MVETARRKFWRDNREAIKRAGETVERELSSRGMPIQTSTGILIALHACAAFAGIPETPPDIALANLAAGLAEA